MYKRNIWFWSGIGALFFDVVFDMLARRPVPEEVAAGLVPAQLGQPQKRGKRD